MIKENAIQLMESFQANKLAIFQIITEQQSSEVEDQTDVAHYYNALMMQPVSKLSIFSDPEWDYNDDNPNHVDNASRYKINFGNFEYISETIICELKCITLLWTQIRKIGQLSNKDKTIVMYIKEALKVLNVVFKCLSEKYSDEYIKSKRLSLSDLIKSDFQLAFKSESIIRRKETVNFFSRILQSEPVRKYVLELPFFIFNETDYAWGEAKTQADRLDILPNVDFERSVTNASVLVVDFLQKMELPINDKATLRRMKVVATEYDLNAYSHIDSYTLNAYRVYRLISRGYSLDMVEQYGIPEEFISQYREFAGCVKSHSKCGKALKNKSGKLKAGKTELGDYLKLIQQAVQCLFIEFTGVRISEFKRFRLNNWEHVTGVTGGKITAPIPRIASKVSKKKDITDGLFNDTWVLIPILVDALSAAEWLSSVNQNPYLLSSLVTLKPGDKAKYGSDNTFSRRMKEFFSYFSSLKPCAQTFRDTLAYQLYRVDLGLPFISYQLKHLVDTVDKETSLGAVANVTLGYGDLGDRLVKNGKQIRYQAEMDNVKASYNPDGNYAGGQGKEHKKRLQKLFQGYIEVGYTTEEVYEAMADQGLGIINVGGALCYGDREEEFNSELPCVGSLRCNPVRCKQAVISEANMPRWHEIYITNKALLDSGEAGDNEDAVREAMNEAKMVIEFVEKQGGQHDASL